MGERGREWGQGEKSTESCPQENVCNRALRLADCAAAATVRSKPAAADVE